MYKVLKSAVSFLSYICICKFVVTVALYDTEIQLPVLIVLYLYLDMKPLKYLYYFVKAYVNKRI